MQIPVEYHGREQSYLKHRVLEEYLLLWGMKIGSTAPERLWYVDCFSGPWQSVSEKLEDTSIHIGLNVLATAVDTWRQQGRQISGHAIFVEKDPKAYAALVAHLATLDLGITTLPLFGEFGDHADDIARRLGKDPAFIFVDPTGFKGVGIRHIAKLANERMRDVLINVMFNHLRRFKDDPREFLREVFREFFGRDLPLGLSEDELMRTYRAGLKDGTTLRYAADLAMPHPTIERTWFRLVVAGHHPKVLEVFRTVEAEVMANEAAQVRTSARDRKTEQRTGQLSLLDTSPARDAWYAKENERGREAAIEALIQEISSREHGASYGQIWPRLLEEHHITLRELSQLVLERVHAGVLQIEPRRARRSRVADDDVISLGAGTP
jgi:three-Cys-motif partner protein